MKKLLFTLLIVANAVPAMAQIEYVRPADFRYYVTVDGDTVSSRSLDYKAYEDALNFKADYPNALVVIQPLGIEVRGSLPVVYDYDVIYEPSPPDTIEVETYVDAVTKYYDHSYGFSGNPWPAVLDSINFAVSQPAADTTGVYRLIMDGRTTASSVSFATNCFGFNGNSRTEFINERTSGADSTDLHGEVYYQTGDLSCQGIMTMWVTERDSGNFAVRFLDIGQILSLN